MILAPIRRIHLHWTAGGASITDEEKDHYNFITATDGRLVEGDFAPEDQTPSNIAKGSDHYAAHTLNANSYAIGHAIDAMANANEKPFKPGPNPITAPMLDAFVRNNAAIVKHYGLKITRETVLTHAEVEPTLGIKQRQKWDITWLPGMKEPGDPIEVGDKLRSMIAAAMGFGEEPSIVFEPAPSQPVLRRGSRGAPVIRLQSLLNAFGFNAGRTDGIFGTQTEIALRAYQRGKGLVVDGIAGKAVWGSFNN